MRGRKILKQAALRILPIYNRGRLEPTRVNSFLEAVIINSEYGYWPDFKNPSTYFELVNREKLYGDFEKLAKLSDKWDIRNLVREKIGEQYLTRIIDIADAHDEIDEARYAGYPEQFVAKPNMASKRIYINRTKNFPQFKKETARFFDEFGNRNNEFHYKLIPKKIIIEELLNPGYGELQELKCLVFSGRLELIAHTRNIYESEREGSTTLRFYDRHWGEPPLQIRENLAAKINAPENLDEIIEQTEKLAADFPFMRVDWYLANGELKFGELTPIPRGGRSFNLNLADHKLLYEKYHMANCLIDS